MTAWSSSERRPRSGPLAESCLPDTAKDKPARGTVVSVGDGKLLDDGRRSKMQVKVGDRVIFSSYAGETFKVNDQELLLMREDDILAIIEG